MNAQQESGTTAVDSEIKPLIKHILPKEQQVYFEHVTSSLVNSNNEAVNEVIKRIRQELGLQLLVPYFVQFAAEMVGALICVRLDGLIRIW